MLDEFRSTSITWDKATRRIYSPITANASDSNGRKLNIQVVNSGQVENLTGATLHLYWETKDKAHDGLDAFDASDISKGEFELFYTTGMLSNVGELNATLVLVDSRGKVVSDWFKITVTRGINEGAIESENSFSSLTQALIDISNLEQNYTPRLNDLTAQLQQTEYEANRKRKLEDLDSEVLSAIEGGEGTSFNLLSIPQDNSVTPSKINANYQPNLFNPETITNGYIVATNGSLTKTDGYYTSDYIEIPEDGDYRFLSNRPSTLIVRFDENKNPLGWIPGVASDDLNASVTQTITGTKYIRVNAKHSLVPPDKYIVAKAEEFDSVDGKIKWLKISNENLASDFKFPTNQTETSRFNGINVLVTGDSITEKNIRATKNWHEYLNDWFNFGNVINDGKSGTGLVKPFEARLGLLDRIASWPTDLDLILIMGAMNDGTSGEFGDVVAGLPVGEFTDAPGKTSVYAAMHKLMQDLIAKYPNTPIGFISSTPRSQVGARGKCWGTDGWFEEYNQAYKEVCAHYSIPFLDLYHQSGLRPWNATNKMTYFSNPENATGDGIHPNELGQELMARKIYEFVKQFM